MLDNKKAIVLYYETAFYRELIAKIPRAFIDTTVLSTFVVSS